MDQYSAAYDQPGHFITVASGDLGFGVTQFPAVLTTVTAVGGTTLNRAANARGWTETAWGNGAVSDLAGGAGSGCSAYVAKPAWQHDGHCHMREVADVSAVADPGTGVAVYDTFASSGWRVVGGTSAAAPIIASAAALAGNTSTVGDSYIYQHAGSLFDVTGGSNGSCYGDYHCTGSNGYDGPTGLGTPDGTGGF
jgi:subtilase family serine protease